MGWVACSSWWRIRAVVVVHQLESKIEFFIPYLWAAAASACLILGNGTLTFLGCPFPLGWSHLWSRSGHLKPIFHGHGQWLRNRQTPKPCQWDLLELQGQRLSFPTRVARQEECTPDVAGGHLHLDVGWTYWGWRWGKQIREEEGASEGIISSWVQLTWVQLCQNIKRGLDLSVVLASIFLFPCSSFGLSVTYNWVSFSTTLQALLPFCHVLWECIWLQDFETVAA